MNLWGFFFRKKEPQKRQTPALLAALSAANRSRPKPVQLPNPTFQDSMIFSDALDL